MIAKSICICFIHYSRDRAIVQIKIVIPAYPITVFSSITIYTISNFLVPELKILCSILRVGTIRASLYVL
nr:MAG TPA: hypothetical protein [Caudoviricetes sp.]